MTNLQEIPTDDLLSFHDFPTVPVHNTVGNSTISVPASQVDVSGNLKSTPQIPIDNTPHQTNPNNFGGMDPPENQATPVKSFWTLEYYQKYFDVDTKDVLERIVASVTPKWDNSLKHHLRTKPDLYGPFWISVTLIFTIAISGNIANYLQHASSKYQWKYDFHLVSYAATTICLYISLVPFTLWGLLKYTSQPASDIEQFEQEDPTPGALELICIYGYSLFIYIPAAILWSIQINLLQWLLVLIAAFISGSVLLLTLLPALRLSKHKFFLAAAIMICHALLAAGFMLYFFHVPNTLPVPDPITVKPVEIQSNINISNTLH
ncbi:protein YIPF1 isoform X2 [Rhynchophorus ferrugineus]|uniref:protein YIPF1 isoform X2 n=1 Tax=Rhynchophorus ferrugineus TaxID=354439 RepID=UPI003FCCB982